MGRNDNEGWNVRKTLLKSNHLYDNKFLSHYLIYFRPAYCHSWNICYLKWFCQHKHRTWLIKEISILLFIVLGSPNIDIITSTLWLWFNDVLVIEQSSNSSFNIFEKDSKIWWKIYVENITALLIFNWIFSRKHLT